ncbi:sulfatase, partial [Rubripirellula sp.]
GILGFSRQVLAKQRPNVVLIIADDLNCRLSPYGDAIAVTPNLQRIADRGLTFTRAYCQQAVCNPSRSSFLTGLRPDTVKVDDLRKSFRKTMDTGEDLVTLPQFFKKNGYFCQNVGKIFHNMGDTQDRESWSIDEVLHQGTHAADTVYNNTPLDQRGVRSPKGPVTESLDVPDTVYRDGQIANLAAAMLREHPEDGQPFFLAVGFWRPHLPFVAPKKYWNQYDPNLIPLSDEAELTNAIPSIALHDSRELFSYGELRGRTELTTAQMRHLRHGYYASISFMDSQVGKILDALEDGGHREDTIVVFTSDHGFHLGEHQLWGKTSNFELDARVPLIIADPRAVGGHGELTTSLSELVDLYPTLVKSCGFGVDGAQYLEGVDLSPILNDPEFSVKQAAVTQHQHPFYASPDSWEAWGYSIRTTDWRYTEWRSVSDGAVIAKELYSHLNDPQESNNVAQAFPQVVAKHSVMLSEYIPPHRRGLP